jgi:hypothetical protein
LAMVFKGGRGGRGELISNCSEETIISIINVLVKKIMSENMCCKAHFVDLNIRLVESIKDTISKEIDKGFRPEGPMH